MVEVVLDDAEVDDVVLVVVDDIVVLVVEEVEPVVSPPILPQPLSTVAAATAAPIAPINHFLLIANSLIFF